VFAVIKYSTGKATMHIKIRVTYEHNILLLNGEFDIWIISRDFMSRKVAVK
jgi:hypothetical protein